MQPALRHIQKRRHHGQLSHNHHHLTQKQLVAEREFHITRFEACAVVPPFETCAVVTPFEGRAVVPSFEACAVVPPFEGRAVVVHVVE